MTALKTAIASLKSYGPDAPVGEAVQQLEAMLKRIEGNEWSLRERKLSKYRSHSYGRMSSKEYWSGTEPSPGFKQQPTTPLVPPPDPTAPPPGSGKA